MLEMNNVNGVEQQLPNLDEEATVDVINVDGINDQTF